MNIINNIKKKIENFKKTDLYCKWFHKRGKLHNAFIDVVNGQQVFGYKCQCGKHFLTQSISNSRLAFRYNITK